ncbi:MAG: UvrB/UvrC motif-containing protein [Candidatus Brocadiia bacterium]
MASDKKKCDICGRREATIHLTDFVDGQPVERDLCEECYAEQDGVPPVSSSQIFQQLVGALAPELEEATNKKCPECGISYLEFRQTLRFGCPNDYEFFSEQLDDLLKQLHGATRHVGRLPSGAAQRGSSQARIQVLKRELDEAVEREDFEKAARFRDRIQELEQDSDRNVEK